MTNAAGFHVLRPPTLPHLVPTPLFVSVLLCQFPFSPDNMEREKNKRITPPLPPPGRPPSVLLLFVLLKTGKKSSFKNGNTAASTSLIRPKFSRPCLPVTPDDLITIVSDYHVQETKTGGAAFASILRPDTVDHLRSEPPETPRRSRTAEPDAAAFREADLIADAVIAA